MTGHDRAALRAWDHAVRLYWKAAECGFEPIGYWTAMALCQALGLASPRDVAEGRA